MHLATTTYDFIPFLPTQAERVRQYEGTGFRFLDYSFDDAFFPGSSFLTDRWMDDVLAAEKAAEQLGFTFVQAHAPGAYNFLDPSADHEAGMLAMTRSIEACGYLGIPNLVVHASTCNRMMGPAGRDSFFRENRQFYEKLFPSMEKSGVNVLVENTGYANQDGKYYLMTGQDMVDFVEYVGHPLLKVCWDTGHANMNFYNQYHEITTIGKYAAAFHMQDNFGVTDDHIAPLMGTTDWDAIMQALFAIDFKGYFTLESPRGIRTADAWPQFRRFNDLPQPCRLRDPSVDLMRQYVKLLFEIGKYILTQYDCFEA